MLNSFKEHKSVITFFTIYHHCNGAGRWTFSLLKDIGPLRWRHNDHAGVLTVVYSIVYSGVNQRKHQSSASLAFVREIHRGPANFPHKWPVTRKMFPFDDVIMYIPITITQRQRDRRISSHDADPSSPKYFELSTRRLSKKTDND